MLSMIDTYTANISGELTSNMAVDVINPDHQIEAYLNDQFITG